MDNILKQAREDMDEVVLLAQDDINSVRAGRAKPSIVQDLKVEAYDSIMTLKEVASISAPDPHNLIIKPWDETVLAAIEKAIHKSDLGLSPVVDKNMVRINIPPLTGEQRNDLAKLVDQKAESARVMIRQVRSAAKEKVDSQKGGPGISEDDVHQARQDLQEMTDNITGQINELAETHKKEITTL